MLSSLSSGVSGIQQYQQEMDVIGNNIANVNTTGFKAGRVNFSDSFSQTMRDSSAGSGTTSASSAIQVGTGVQISSIHNDYTQGTVTRTGVPTDLAVSGNGLFVVRDPISGESFVTRDGAFRVDSSNFLITQSGYRVQGYSDAGLTTLGDIQINNTGAPNGSTAAVSSYSIGEDGKIHVRLADSSGTDFVRGQVLLQNFSDPQALVKEGNNLYSGMVAAGALAAPVPPGTAGVGKVQAGALEMSNVDLANQFSTMITTQRAFQACARIITTSDEMLQELVNLKR